MIRHRGHRGFSLDVIRAVAAQMILSQVEDCCIARSQSTRIFAVRHYSLISNGMRYHSERVTRSKGLPQWIEDDELLCNPSS